MKPFPIEWNKSPTAKMRLTGGVVCHPIFWKINLTKNTRAWFFSICNLIDEETGILMRTFSDGTKVPLSDPQIAIYFGNETARAAVKNLVSYGVFAEITVARTKIYVANPYVINKGGQANAYLRNIFNAVTLKRNDKFNSFFEVKNEEEFKRMWDGEALDGSEEDDED